MAFNDKLLEKNSSVYPGDFAAQVSRKRVPLYLSSVKAAPATKHRFPYSIDYESVATLDGKIYTRATKDDGTLDEKVHGTIDVNVTGTAKNTLGVVTSDVAAVVTPSEDFTATLAGAGIKIALVEDTNKHVYFEVEVTGATANAVDWYLDLAVTEIKKKPNPFRGI